MFHPVHQVTAPRTSAISDCVLLTSVGNFDIKMLICGSLVELAPSVLSEGEVGILTGLLCLQVL